MASPLPLDGVKILELSGLAPGPFAGMVLADFGADVVRVDRNGSSFNVDTLARGKRSISLSLKSPDGVAVLRTLLSAPPLGCSNPRCQCSGNKLAKCQKNVNKDLWRADVLIDPFRPGVLERLGLGPDVLLKANPALIIARLTGFRRTGPYSSMAGHDINYVALSGVLSMLGRKSDKPYFPANLLADFAGGGIMAVMGILMALLERNRSGKGQVVEIDMVTGTRYISSFPLILSRPTLGLPLWDQARGENLLDGGAPWYDVYETSDGGYMSVGALENHFYAIFLEKLLYSVPASILPKPLPTAGTQMDRSTWPALAEFFTAAFLTKTRKDWASVYLSTDACCVPVLNRNEVDSEGLGFDEPGNQLSRENFENGDGMVPSAAPKLSRTPADCSGRAYQDGKGFFLTPGKNTRDVLQQAGMGNEIGQLIQNGAVESSDEDSKAKL